MTGMKAHQLRQKYLDNFKNKNHAVIPSAPLVPINDPTTLFTSSGMQPLVPYLLGQPHPEGQRLVNSQKCFRSQDIEDVGDNRHTTFFEMLGNWSLGDYFKQEQLAWFFEFLTHPQTGIGLDPKRLYVTIFSGDKETGISRDQEALEIWEKLFATKKIPSLYVELDTEAKGSELGMQDGRIFGYGVAKNWWSRSGVPAKMPAGEPGGPDSEVFYDLGTPHDTKYGKHCHPNCDCGRFVEIGNSVFMQFKKLDDGSLEELPNKNVDFGGGFERLLAVTNGHDDVFRTDLFQPIIDVLEKLSGRDYANPADKLAMRVIADHLKGSVFLIADGVEPGNKGQGYFLRRLIRRSVVKLHQIGIVDTDQTAQMITQAIFQIYQPVYLTEQSLESIAEPIRLEMERFNKTLAKGMKMFNKAEQITGKIAFDLLQSYGFPWELTLEMAQENGQTVDKDEFAQEFKRHQDLSRTASKGMFKGGLADQSETTTKLHTATHLLHAALRNILGTHVRQEGSHITPERLRFDFSHTSKLTQEEIEQIEHEMNQKIDEKLAVTQTVEAKDEAIKSGAIAFFREKYPDQVSVYTIGPSDNFYSKELCGGPHVKNTQEIGQLKILKQESIGANKRRVYVSIVK